MLIWEVTIVDKADFDAELFCELFLSKQVAHEVGERELASYRADADEEFRNSIELNIVRREVL